MESEVQMAPGGAFITAVCDLTTTPFLTRFELARVVGTRALQIAHGAQVRVETAGTSTDPIAIALLELRARRIDMVVRRKLPNGHVENVRVADLLLDESAIDVL